MRPRGLELGLTPERVQAGLVNGRATKCERGQTYDPLKPIPKSREAPRGETKGNRDDRGEERHPENRAEAEEQHVDHADRGGWRALQSKENQSSGVLPLLSVGEMTLRLYSALNYSQNSARDLRFALNEA